MGHALNQGNVKGKDDGRGARLADSAALRVMTYQ
jgi:hypothetical protein